MSSVLFDLPHQTVMDDGTIVLSYTGCIELAKRNRDFHEYFVKNDARFENYNKFSGKPVQVFSGQTKKWSNEWTIPEEYRNIDIEAQCMSAIEALGLDVEIYVPRVKQELNEFQIRGMTDSLRFMVFFTDTLKSKNMMWGVGRGSSCASLLLYLLGVNRIDPVRYDIPLEEFLR